MMDASLTLPVVLSSRNRWRLSLGVVGSTVFKRHLRVYQLEKRVNLPNEEKKTKKQKCSRGHHEYKGKKG